MNKVISEIFQNSMLYSSIFSWIAAQVLKTLYTKITTGKFVASRLVGPGGMPSSHAAMMAALTVAVARKYGVSGPAFAICLVLSFIIMYDAMGVRWHAGEHARLLNRLVEILTEDKNDPEEYQKLQEVLGHRPIEVFVGAAVGVTIGFLVPVL